MFVGVSQPSVEKYFGSLKANTPKQGQFGWKLSKFRFFDAGEGVTKRFSASLEEIVKK